MYYVDNKETLKPVKTHIWEEDEAGNVSVDNERFINGKLTATGCFDRHNAPRDEWNETKDMTSLFGLSEWHEEQRLLSQVYELLDKGFKLRRHKSISERLESFITRHGEVLCQS